MEMVGVVVAQDPPHSMNPQMFPILMKILQGRYDPSFIPGAQESLAIYPGAPGNKKAVRSGTSWISAAFCTCLAMSCDTVLGPARTLQRAFQTHVVASLWSQSVRESPLWHNRIGSVLGALGRRFNSGELHMLQSGPKESSKNSKTKNSRERKKRLRATQGCYTLNCVQFPRNIQQ